MAKLELINTEKLENLEILIDGISIFIPHMSIGSLILNSINKKYAQKNLELLVKKINELDVRLEKLETKNENEIRNFCFETRKTIEMVINEKIEEKINHYASLICIGINSESIFSDNDEYAWNLEILSKLSLNDIFVLEKIEENTVYDYGDSISITTFKKEYIEGYDSDEDYENYYGFKENDYFSLPKLCSLGLLDEIYKIKTTETLNDGLKINYLVILTKKYFIFKESIGNKKYTSKELYFSK